MLWGIPAEVNRFFRPVLRDVSKPIRRTLAPTVPRFLSTEAGLSRLPALEGRVSGEGARPL